MGVFQDVWAFVGPKGIPIALAAATFGAFEFLEKTCSDEARAALTKFVRALDIHRASILPEGTRDLFEGVFGKHHLSLKCFIRSVCLSLGTIALLCGLAFLSLPFLGHLGWYALMTVQFSASQIAAGWPDIEAILDRVLAIVFIVWICWSVIIDYLDLYKTRIILNILSAREHWGVIGLGFLVLCDAVFTALVFWLSLTTVHSVASILMPYLYDDWARQELGSLYKQPWPIWKELTFFPYYFYNFSLDYLERIPSIVTLRDTVLNSILFYAGLMPSVWLWLYVLSLFLTRIILRSDRLFDWLRWFLAVDTKPFRSVGVVASGLVFIVSIPPLVLLSFMQS